MTCARAEAPMPATAFAVVPFVPTCCAAARSECAPPPTLPLACRPLARAAAFLLDERHAVTALHTLRDARSISVGGRRTAIERCSPQTDLALLALAQPLGAHPGTRLSTVAVPGAHYDVASACADAAPARLTLLHLGFEIVLAAAARIPMLVLHDENRAVSPGWSGAPVVCPRTGAVIGIVTQILDDDLVHAVPARFLDLLAHHQPSKALRSLSFLPGISTQPLELAAARRAAGVESSHGVRISRCIIHKSVHVGDILTSVNGRSVSSAGTVDWHGTPAAWQAAVCETANGELIPVELVRAGSPLTLSLSVRDVQEAVSAQAWISQKAVLAGEAVFTALSFELLSRWGIEWRRDAPSDLVSVAVAERSPRVKEVVVLAAHAGEEDPWEGFQFLRVVAVDDHQVFELADLVGESGEDGEMTVGFANGFVLCLPSGRFVDINVEGDDAGRDHD